MDSGLPMTDSGISDAFLRIPKDSVILKEAPRNTCRIHHRHGAD
jgi:hypothetical protein